jgi:hypothetical protein
MHAEIIRGVSTCSARWSASRTSTAIRRTAAISTSRTATRSCRTLESEARVLNDTFGYRARMVSREEIHSDFVRDAEARGAMYEPDGMGIHAAKLAFGYLRLARRLGATVHASSPVLDCTAKGGVHYLRTPGGTVRARAVCIATAGYTSPGMNALTKHRLMPILSNSVVTRPLTAAEQQALNFKARIPLTDTRTLRHYYRMLPDGRVQIGSRSAITGRDATNPKHLALLLEGLYRKFPILRGIEIDYSWWGWVDVSHDMMPRIFQPDPDAKPVLRHGLWRQRRHVFGPGRPPHGPDGRRQGRRPRPAHLHLAAAQPRACSPRSAGSASGACTAGTTCATKSSNPLKSEREPSHENDHRGSLRQSSPDARPRTCLRHHRLGHDAGVGPVSRRPASNSGTARTRPMPA